MAKIVSIGNQNYESIRVNDCYYIDKTHFIEEWWESKDVITLITRPRRFGKTLNLDMLNCFFSMNYTGRSDLFEGLSIWKHPNYRQMQGTYPVIYLSFASIKSPDKEEAITEIKRKIWEQFLAHNYLLEWNALTAKERAAIEAVGEDMTDTTAKNALNLLCKYLYQYHGKKVLILLDEYDTPIQEAYLNGYWDEFTSFLRGFFNAAFKTNPYLEKGLMTGITRISKESIFSDLNNLKVVTTTSDLYADCFGFTEEEVFNALEEHELGAEKDMVKKWYDGFTFGTHKDIYNPWSITNFLDSRKYFPYWSDSSSNGLISQLLQTASANIKKQMEHLMARKTITVELDEQIIFSQLEKKAGAIWSLLLASGYLKVESTNTGTAEGLRDYELSITNFEVFRMFETMILDWFLSDDGYYNDFIKALIQGNVEEMNAYMNEIALETFSFFDTGKSPRKQPERFYHGFVLGLLVELRNQYEIISNGESGFGRYDIMMIPLKEQLPGIIIEFKVFQPAKEHSLEETVSNALTQIREKQYTTRLLSGGIKKEQISCYGFAFDGKTVLIKRG